MTDAIEEIMSRMARYPLAEVRANASSVTYYPPSPDGFIVRLIVDTPVPRLMVLSGSGSLQLSWLVPSEPFVLEESQDLLGWSPVAVAPALNYTNLHYEVNLPAPIAPRFFRLASQ